MYDNRSPEEILADCADSVMEMDAAQFDLNKAKEWCTANAAPPEVWMILASTQQRIMNTRRMTKRRARQARRVIEES